MILFAILGVCAAFVYFALSKEKSNMFANIGALVFAYALGVVKDQAGAFTWGFLAASAACLVGLLLTVALARMRNKALAAQLAQ